MSVTDRRRNGPACDFLVVGGGVIGLASALALARSGLSVRVIDRGAGPGSGSSGAAAGIVSLLYPWEFPDALDALARRSCALYPDWSDGLARASGIDCAWRRIGLSTHDVAPDAKAWATATGVALERRDDTLWMPDVGIVDPLALLRALEIAVREAGVVIEWDVPVDALVAKGARIAGVRCGSIDVEAANVLVAGGAWSAALTAPLGIALPVRPVRGQVIELDAPGVLDHIVMRDHRYLMPKPDGRIVVGSTVEEVGFDSGTTEEAAVELLEFAHGLVPATRSCPVVAQRSGLRPGSPDGVPWIGPVPGREGLWLNVGHFRNGITLAPASAELLAAQVTGSPPPVTDAAFRPPVAG